MPSFWGSSELAGQKIPAETFATYRLLIKNNEKEKLLGISIHRIETAYKLWINGNLVAQNGKVGESFEQMTPKWSSREYYFKTQGEFTELIVQVSNFCHKKGGMGKSISIGNASHIAHENKKAQGIDIFLIGIMLIIGLYHIGLFIIRPKAKTTLFFAFVMLATALFTFVTSEFIILNLFPNFSWHWLVKINYISNYTRAIFFALFLAYLFEEEISVKFMKIMGIIGAVMISISLVLPTKILSYTFMIMVVYAAISILYAVTGVLRATFRKRDGALSSLLGAIALVIAIINDILRDLNVLETIRLVPFGLFLFIFFQSFMLSLRSARSFSIMNLLTERLSVLSKIIIPPKIRTAT